MHTICGMSAPSFVLIYKYNNYINFSWYVQFTLITLIGFRLPTCHHYHDWSALMIPSWTPKSKIQWHLCMAHSIYRANALHKSSPGDQDLCIKACSHWHAHPHQTRWSFTHAHTLCVHMLAYAYNDYFQCSLCIYLSSEPTRPAWFGDGIRTGLRTILDAFTPLSCSFCRKSSFRLTKNKFWTCSKYLCNDPWWKFSCKCFRDIVRILSAVVLWLPNIMSCSKMPKALVPLGCCAVWFFLAWFFMEKIVMNVLKSPTCTNVVRWSHNIVRATRDTVLASCKFRMNILTISY